MRLSLVSLMGLLLCFACTKSNNSFRLTVTGENIGKYDIVLQNNTDHASRTPDIINPVSKKENELVFEGSLAAPCSSSLKTGDKVSSQFIMSNTKVKIKLDAETGEVISVDGGYQQEMKEEYDRLLRTEEKNKLYSELRKLKRGSDEFLAVYEKVKELGKDDIEINKSFIEDHPDAMMSPFALWHIYSKVGEEEAIRLFHHIDTALNKQAQYVFVEKTIKAWERSPVGSQVPDLSQNTPDGESISLHDYLGNYLLVDFWASWCGPCRAANPMMVELYGKYHEKGLEMLGVSLDKQADDWKKAIEDDKLSWDHVSDLSYWNNEISRYFGVNSIPSTLLIDPEGRIVAKKLHGDELVKKLEEIFE